MRKKNPTKEAEEAVERAAARSAVTVRRLLLAAYDAGKRSLPWRGETDPYRIWVSEVMLQQTRVETVIPYYGRWLERFPDIETLAAAEEDEVLRVWQGLGYYSRARRLHEGARVVRERHGGSVPGSSEELRDLPGVGHYTAGAVASIAFGEAVPAVDGNVRRVLSRLFDLPDPSPIQLRRLSATLVDPKRPGDFNQALMELGALVCVPRSPRCGECPLRSVCLALEEGTVDERPALKSKKKLREVDVVVVVAVARDDSGEIQFLLRKRPDTGLLAGMWEFPGVAVEEAPALEAARRLATDLGLKVRKDSLELEMITHLFSHLKVRYRPFFFVVEGWRGQLAEPAGNRWILESDLDEVPLSVAQGKILQGVMEQLRS